MDFSIDPSQLQYLATNYDPTPILAGMGGQGLQASPSQQMGFANIVNPWSGGGGGGGAPTAPMGSGVNPGAMAPTAPTGMIDPKLMQQFSGMLQTPQYTPHFIGGASPQRPGQVSMAMMPGATMTANASAKERPSLAQILQGR